MIQQLSEDVRSHLRSGVAVSSVVQCVEELVVNSLDAEATCIAVRVDLQCFKVQVVDNGKGMTYDSLQKVGERYCTSKCHVVEDLEKLHYFGYRGEAIASIRDTAAMVEISSRTKESQKTYCKMFKKGTPLTVTDSSIPRPSIGTTVTVHDLFYSLPVRRKSVNEALELERIRYRIEGIALIHPSVSWSLRNDVTGHTLLQTKKSNSLLTSFTHLFGISKARCLREAKTQKECFSVDGYVGREGHHNKSLQFIFVNSRLVLKTKIHKLLNTTLGKHLMLKKKFVTSESGDSDPRTSSPTKQGEKHAIFVLNVKCPINSYDITFDPAKTLIEFKDWGSLTRAVEEMIVEFLRRENLLCLSEDTSISPPNKPAESSDVCVTEESAGTDRTSTDESCSDAVQMAGGDENKSQSELQTYTENISTINTSNSLFSKTVKRPVFNSGKSNDQDSFKDGQDSESPSKNNSVEISSGLLGGSGDHDENESLSKMSASQRENVVETKSMMDNVEKSDTAEISELSVVSVMSAVSDSLSDNPASSGVLCVSSSESVMVTCDPGSSTETGAQADSTEGEDLPVTQPETGTSTQQSDEEGEDPVPHCLRNKEISGSTEKSLSRSRLQRKGLICLPDSPEMVRKSSGIQKLRGIRLVSEKSGTPACEKMSKRLGLISTTQLKAVAAPSANVGAAQKISERLGCLGPYYSMRNRREISAKLDKFKSMQSKSAINLPSSSETANNDQSEKGEPVFQCVTDAENNHVPPVPTNVCQIVLAQKEESKMTIDVVRSSNHPTEKCPIIPTISEIDSITSMCEVSSRKRFNPFELSTASKLSKLARKSSCATQNSEQKSFLSTSSLLETPSSVFKGENENGQVKLAAGGTEQFCWGKREAVMPPQDTAPKQFDLENCEVSVGSPDQFPASNEHVSNAPSSGVENIEAPPEVTLSDNQSYFLTEVMNVTSSTCLDVDKGVQIMPFAEGGDSSVMRNKSESMFLTSESSDLEVLTDSEGGTLGCDRTLSLIQSTQGFDPVVDSQGFSPPVKPVDFDCRSEGFTPNLASTAGSPIVDSVTPQHLCSREKEKCQPSSSSVELAHVSDNMITNQEIDGSQAERQGNCVTSSSAVVELQAYQDSPPASTEERSRMCSCISSTLAKGSNTSQPTCGQNPLSARSMDIDDSDSFPLRKLLPTLSPDSETQPENNWTSPQFEICEFRDGKNLCITEQKQHLSNTTEKEESQVDESLLKEFESNMSQELTSSKDNSTRTESGEITASILERAQSTGINDSLQSPVDRALHDNGSTEDRAKSPPTWSEMKDPNTGKTIHINNLTGNTMFDEQWQMCNYKDELKNQKETETGQRKAALVPLSPSAQQTLHHMLESHLEAETGDDQIKWRQPCSSGYSGDQSSMEDLFSSWENPVTEIPQQSCCSAEVSHSSRAASKSYQSLYPTKFTKDMLTDVQVLGQVDNKFIACMIKTVETKTSADLIVLFDQHAVHERVRLEQLTQDIYVSGGDQSDSFIKQSQVTPPWTLSFTEEEVRLVKSFREEFKRLGVTFTINGSSRDSLNIHSVPACLVEREANEVRRGRSSVVMEIVESLMKEHLEMLKSTKGARNRLPQVLHKVLCSQACHGAIKFGDGLTLDQCCELLESLSLCDLPFQCAHGRPSIMPLINLEQLRTKSSQETLKYPSLWKVSQHLPIHQ